MEEEMRLKSIVALVGVFILLSSSISMAESNEDKVVNSYLKKMEKKHAHKLTWISGTFSFNRINRHNDYNDFANYESNNFPSASISWLNDAKILGLELGVVFNDRFAWSLNGEYWLKLGQDLSGSYYYNPIASNIENPKSDIHVYGFSTGLQYYFYNHPDKIGELKKLALRFGGSVGFYQVNWDLWSQYANLNLATNTSTGNNTTFKDNAPGFTVNIGSDYPIKLYKLVLGFDISYLYLNFNDVAWYNSLQQEVVATYNSTPDSRVDLNFSGVTAKMELKRFFSW